MKTAEEKVSDLLNRLNIRGKLYDNIKPELILALKLQDRDTRHACAEAVAGIIPDSIDIKHDAQFIMQDRAYDACMNARAV